MPLYRLTPHGPVQAGPASVSLAEASLALPRGVYTTLRTYGGHCLLRLDEHLARLEASARLLGAAIVALPGEEVRAGLRAALASAGFAESRMRLTATFARSAQPGELCVALEPLAPPEPALYTEGVHAATLAMAREWPRAKSTDFIPVAAKLYARKPPGVYEYLMVGADGAILEGLTSNFFGVRAGVVYTAESGVLEGVTRALVLEVAARQGWPVRFAAVTREAVPGLDEAFITSSSREIVPVAAVDAALIGTGRPGAVTQALLAGYREQVAQECEK